jgi:heat shock protein HtpX
MKEFFADTLRQFLRFLIKKPLFVLLSFGYYLLASFLLSGTWQIYFFIFVIYMICLFIAFSSLGEKLLRFWENVRRLETSQEKEYLYPLFEEVFEKAQKNCNMTHKVDIYIIDKMQVNAFALGKNTVAVTKGAVETFSEDQLKAIIAHEIAHIFNFDAMANLFVLIGNGLFSIAVIICRLFIFLIDFIFSHFEESGVVRFATKMTRLLFDLSILACTFVLQVLLSINSRKSEYKADQFAFEIGYGEEMIDALYLLEKINLSDNRTVIQRMISSHPRLSARIERLELMIDEDSQR